MPDERTWIQEQKRLAVDQIRLLEGRVQKGRKKKRSIPSAVLKFNENQSKSNDRRDNVSLP